MLESVVERSVHEMGVSKRPVSILIVDDHVVVRKGLCALFAAQGWKVVGEAGTGRDAVELAKRVRPQIVVTDIMMPQFNGVDAIAPILKTSPDSRILIFSMLDEPELIEEALHAGASGYVLKSDVEQSLLRAVAALSAGKTFVSPLGSRRLFPPKPSYADSRGDHLTYREIEVVQLLAEGLSNKQVAGVLEISVRTAENHRARLMKKLGIHSLSGLVRYAIRHHMIPV